MRRGSPTLAAWIAIPALLLASSGAAAAELPLRVVTSIPPLAMLVAEVGGDRVLAHSLLPPGADPHTFEPKPSDAVAIGEADVVVVLGSSLDGWIGQTVEPSSKAIVVRLDEARDDHEGHGDHEEGHHHDPHVWLDPLWVRDHAIPPLHRALAEADPAGAAHYGVAARAAAEKMSELDEDVREAFEGAATRSFLAWHPAWDRFAHRFGLVPIGSVGESSGREPSMRAMVDAIRAARAAGVRAVLVEPQVDSRQARVLADELAVPIVTVDPLGDAWSLDRSTYPMLMRYNAKAFARALGVERDEKDDAPVSAIPAPGR